MSCSFESRAMIIFLFLVPWVVGRILARIRLRGLGCLRSGRCRLAAFDAGDQGCGALQAGPDVVDDPFHAPRGAAVLTLVGVGLRVHGGDHLVALAERLADVFGEVAPCLALPARGRHVHRVAGGVLLPAAGQYAQVHDRHTVARGTVFRVGGQTAPDDGGAWILGQLLFLLVLVVVVPERDGRDEHRDDQADGADEQFRGGRVVRGEHQLGNARAPEEDRHVP
nr:MAG TPA: hypothetical protein [Caudoviricetes sp.]